MQSGASSRGVRKRGHRRHLGLRGAGAPNHVHHGGGIPLDVDKCIIDVHFLEADVGSGS